MPTHTVSIADTPSGTYTKVRTLLGDPESWDYKKPLFIFEGDAALLAAVLGVEGVQLVSSVAPAVPEVVEPEPEVVEPEVVEPDPVPTPAPAAAPPTPNVEIWVLERVGIPKCVQRFFKPNPRALTEFRLANGSGPLEQKVHRVVVVNADGTKTVWPK